MNHKTSAEKTAEIEIYIGREFIDKKLRDKRMSVFCICLPDSTKRFIFKPDGNYREHCTESGEDLGKLIRENGAREYKLVNGKYFPLSSEGLRKLADCEKMPDGGVKDFVLALERTLNSYC